MWRRAVALTVGIFQLACAYEGRHQIQWDSRRQIWQAEASQVKVRAAQSRVFEGTDKLRTVEAVVDTLQDLDFQIDVLDENLGVVSGEKFVDIEKPALASDAGYFLYDEDDLMLFSKTFRSWGPFWHRSDLVRLTVTVRERNAAQLVVRASAQFYLLPIENPEPYQKFFRTLEQALFVQRQLGAAAD